MCYECLVVYLDIGSFGCGMATPLPAHDWS